MKAASFITVIVFVLIAGAILGVYFLFPEARTVEPLPNFPAATTTIPVIPPAGGAVASPSAATSTGKAPVRDLPALSGTPSALYPVAPSAGSEWTPDLYAQATKEVTGNTRWSAITSSVGQNDIVRIPAGITVTYDVASTSPVKAIVVRGSLIFEPTASTKLSVGTIFVSDSGRLDIEPASGHTAEIIFHGSVAEQSQADPAQLLLGLVAVGGEVKMVGRQKSTPFAHVSGQQGATTIHMDSAAGWNVGDEVFLAASGPSDVDPTYWWFNIADFSQRHAFPEQGERARIVAVSGNDVTLDRALAYSHDSYAADLTRSIYIHSDPANPSHARGHVMFAGPVSATVQNARLSDLGRTTVGHTDDTTFSDQGAVFHFGANERGRYALHVHHLSLPFSFTGNVIDGSPKWGIVNHDSFGDIRDNVVIGAAGAGVVGEDGTEVGTVDHNLVIGTGGGSGQNDDDRFGTTQGQDMGHGGFGFWFRGPFLNVTNNVATGHFNQTAYLYFLHPQFVRNSLSNLPWIPADLRGKAHGDLVSREPVRQFSGNVADGFFGQGGFMMFYSETPDTISDLTIRARGKGATNGVLGRHIDQLTVANSSITADSSTGAAIVSNPDAGTVVTSGTTVSGFAQ